VSSAGGEDRLFVDSIDCILHDVSQTSRQSRRRKIFRISKFCTFSQILIFCYCCRHSCWCLDSQALVVPKLVVLAAMKFLAALVSLSFISAEAFSIIGRFSYRQQSHRRVSSLQGGQNDNNNNNNNNNNKNISNNSIFYDDFGDSFGAVGDDIVSSVDDAFLPENSLTARIRGVSLEEQFQRTQLKENWETGNWNVRGFSLDPTTTTTTSDNDSDADDNSEETTLTDAAASKIIVSCLCQEHQDDDDDDEESESADTDTIVVGRTDGSVCVVRLGTEYLARFTNQLTAKQGAAENTFTVQRELQRETNNKPPSLEVRDNDDDDDNDDNPSGGRDTPNKEEMLRPSVPFEIVSQFQACSESSPITNMLLLEDVLFTTSSSPNGQIQQWKFGEDDASVALAATMEMPSALSCLPCSKIVDLKFLERRDKTDQTTLVVAVCSSGIMALFDSTTAQLIAFGQVPPMQDQDSMQILCMDVDRKESFIYLGTDSGHVVVYSLANILATAHDDIAANPTPLQPKRTFVAYEKEQVTAIASAGTGNLGRTATGGGKSSSSRSLVTGSSQGVIKQWELLPRGNGKDSALEYWPKLKTQKIPNRAHILGSGGSGGETRAHATHRNPIRALYVVFGRGDESSSSSTTTSRNIVSACNDSLIVWDPVSGKERFGMQGLEFSAQDAIKPSLLISQSLLITNGMDCHVCVHDFNIPELQVDDESNFEP
jgi:hypothetical protein